MTLLWFVAVIAGLGLACDPVVGGDCASSAVVCGEVCCGTGSLCVRDGVCTPDPSHDAGPADADASTPRDGGPRDGSDPRDGGAPDGDVGRDDAGDGSTPDASSPDGSPDVGPADGGPADDGGGSRNDGGPTPDGGPPDGGGPTCPLGTQLCGGFCVDTDSDTTHCGACNSNCNANELCVVGTCTINCPPPRVVCANRCVDVQSDPDFCGTCQTECSTGICFSGSCVAASAGHVVLIGHDFTSPQPGVGRLVGNAVLIPTGNPVRVGTFAEQTSAPVRTAVDTALNETAAELGRTYQFVPTTETNVTQRLATVDTFLVYPQDLATDGQLTSWGTQWQLALDGFVRSGGAIVVVDAGGSHAGTWQILDSAGLFSVQARTPLVVGSTLTVSNAADSVSLNVPLTFPAPANSVTFTTSAIEVVVETSSAVPQPAVFHRVVRP